MARLNKVDNVVHVAISVEVCTELFGIGIQGMAHGMISEDFAKFIFELAEAALSDIPEAVAYTQYLRRLMGWTT